MTHDVFLSYSRKDIQLMHRVRQSLIDGGLTTVWTDEGITPGTPSWDAAIEEALQTAQCMVVILTPNVKNAKGVRDEIHYANIHGIRIFPLLAAGTEQSAVPYSLSGTQWVDVRTDYDESIHKLVAGIQLFLNRPVTTTGQILEAKQTKARSNRLRRITAIGAVVLLLAASLLVFLQANDGFRTPSTPDERQQAMTAVAQHETESSGPNGTATIGAIMTRFVTETRAVVDSANTSTAEAYTDTPTYTPTDNLTATANVRETLNAQAAANVPTDTPQPTPSPTLTPTNTVTPTTTPTPSVEATQTADALLAVECDPEKLVLETDLILAEKALAACPAVWEELLLRLQTATDQSLQEDDYNKQAHFVTYRGIISYYMGDYQNALYLHSVALLIYREEDNQIEEGRSLYYLGRIYTAMERGEDASLFFAQATAIAHGLANQGLLTPMGIDATIEP